MPFQPRLTPLEHATWVGTTGVKKHKVLLVEDDTLIGMLLADLLDEMGYGVCAVAGTQADAVLAAAHHKPDLMIVDIDLGQSSGALAVEEILHSGFIPHVFMSGNPSWFLNLRPGTVTLLKPFGEAELLDAIEHALAAGVPMGQTGRAVPKKRNSLKVKI